MTKLTLSIYHHLQVAEKGLDSLVHLITDTLKNTDLILRVNLLIIFTFYKRLELVLCHNTISI